MFTAALRRRDKALLVAGGIGITPVRALLEEMTGDLVVVYRVLRADDAVLLAELEQLADRRGFRLELVAGDHATEEGRALLTPPHLLELVPDAVEREVYVCGPPAMATALEQSVRAVGVPRRFVHVEKFAL